MTVVGRLARRFGFEPTISAALVGDWLAPSVPGHPITLAPRGGAQGARVDRAGTIQPIGASWSLAWSVAAGATWMPVLDHPRSSQQLLGAATLETTIATPRGPIVQRCAAALVDGRPAIVVEIENASTVAAAVGLVARPLGLTARGHMGEASVGPDGIVIEGTRVVRFEAPPAATSVQDAAAGDLLAVMAEPTSGGERRSVRCRSGGAQVAAVWPLAHTAMVRYVVELDGPTAATSPVPSTDDVNRGWQTHLGRSLGAEVDDEPVTDALVAAQRTLLTVGPTGPDTLPDHLVALAETGHGLEVSSLLHLIERLEEPALLVAAARWFQLAPDHDLLDAVLTPVARAAHIVAGAGGRPTAPVWAPAALNSLADGLDVIGQPDVADRVRGFECVEPEVDHATAMLAALRAGDDRWVWPEPGQTERALRSIRAALLADRDRAIDVLPDLPERWRGRAVELLRAPVAGGTFSYGIRWHGARPALLWEYDGAADAPIVVTAQALDPGFESTDHAGEALLADPGWSRSG